VDKIEIGSEKSFGIVFSIVFLSLAIYLFFNNYNYSEWALIASISFLFFAFFLPRILRWPNIIWARFGLFLGSIISPIFLTLLFLSTIVPIGLFLRLFKIDILNVKLMPNSKTYWIERKDEMNSMKNQF